MWSCWATALQRTLRRHCRAEHVLITLHLYPKGRKIKRVGNDTHFKTVMTFPSFSHDLCRPVQLLPGWFSLASLCRILRLHLVAREPSYFHENGHRNAPANIIDPINLTAAAVDMAERLGLSAKILDEKELVCAV